MIVAIWSLVWIRENIFAREDAQEAGWQVHSPFVAPQSHYDSEDHKWGNQQVSLISWVSPRSFPHLNVSLRQSNETYHLSKVEMCYRYNYSNCLWVVFKGEDMQGYHRHLTLSGLFLVVPAVSFIFQAFPCILALLFPSLALLWPSKV